MDVPTKAAYDAAKQHQTDSYDEYCVPEPSAEVLANVAVIRAYETEQDRLLNEKG